MIDARSILTGLCGLVLLGASACGSPYETIDVEHVAGHPQAHGSDAEFSVPEGGLLVFEVDPMVRSGRRDYEPTDSLELTTVDPSVARIEQGLATDTWMLMGVAQGRTTLQVRINGAVEDEIPVEVVEQEGAP